jgi:hypothetical protein
LYQAEGTFPGIDLTRTDAAVQQAFAAVPANPAVASLAELTAHTQPELAAAYITRLEADWTARILQKRPAP